MKKIHYDTNDVDGDKARIIGIYDDAVHNTIPSPVVEVDETTWGDIIAARSDHRRVDVNTFEIVSYTPPRAPVTSDRVNRERDRRIALGISVTTSVAGTFPVQTRSRDLFNITGLATLAQQRVSESDTTAITFRNANNTDQTLTPSEMIEVAKQVAAHVDGHYKAAWAVKDTDPIPQDYADNRHWP